MSSPIRSIRSAIRAGLATVLAMGSGLTAAAQAEPFAMSDSTVTACIGELTDSGGPNEAYGNNENLTFTIDAGAPLEVGFFGAIDIEAAAPGSGLLFDFLVLYDGPTTNAPVLDTLFGSISSPPNYTTQGALTVQFVSDASAQPQGFHLFWSANPPPPTPTMTNLDGPG
ncbi:MAG: CUB domain-containing protein, partial [Flavobacteriales bacterium]|nr:CUB domain-containing protein [Flavobacteriales bacterium]